MTVSLKSRDIDAATEAKHRLEEKQRGEARERKENEMQWETRVSVPILITHLQSPDSNINGHQSISRLIVHGHDCTLFNMSMESI